MELPDYIKNRIWKDNLPDGITLEIDIPQNKSLIDVFETGAKEYADKAGAYGIQGLASLFIKKIEGCYFNIVGFPLGKFYQSLKNIKIN